MNEETQQRIAEIEAEGDLEQLFKFDVPWLVSLVQEQDAQLREVTKERDQYWEAYSVTKQRDQALGFADAARFKAERDQLKKQLAEYRDIVQDLANNGTTSNFDGTGIECLLCGDDVLDHDKSCPVLRARKAIEGD